MLLHALHIVRYHLNQHLNSLAANNADNVVIANVAVNDNDQYTPLQRDQIVLSLVRIEEEKVLKNTPAGRRNTATGEMEYRNPPVFVNLYCLFSINSNQYENAMTYLSRVVRFFQHKQIFTSRDPISFNGVVIPENDRLEHYRLTVELYTPSFEELNHIWSVLGSKMLPSVMYKLRLLELELDQVQQAGPLIDTIMVDSE
jgi:hypothetical protein